ncbi:MAG: NAD(+) diphosphatase [Proteobacteria bacterium]|nr:NAD(+) diphosphatase [Pseudomonadota bacterium]
MSDAFLLSERRAPDHLAFAHFPLDRAAHRRDDGAWLDAMFNAAGGGCFAICGDMVLVKAGEAPDALFRAGELPEGARERVFLGLDGEAARFCTVYDPDRAESLSAMAGLALLPLRQAAIERLMPSGRLSELAAGKALLHWHATHRFCAACGAGSEPAQAGWRRDCPACKAQHFPRTDPVVIMLAVRDGQCLLGRQARFPQGNYSCLAGFCEPGETIEDAVRREILEEAGIRTGRVRYLASQPWPFPASMMIGCLAEATSSVITRDETELEDVRWFSREEAQQLLSASHPQGLRSPASFAIARHILKAWAVGGAEF